MKLPLVLKTYLQEIFYLDLRSLALLRIGLGIISIYNLYTFLPEIDDFFGPDGVAPASHFKHVLPWSLYMLNDSFAFTLCLFVLHACFSLMLIVGYRTQLATILCWIMTVSLFNRIAFIAMGGDQILKILLMWGMFLPLGARFSIDHALTKNIQPESNRYISAGTFAFICQLAIIYVVNALVKLPITSWSIDYTALHYILNYFATKPLGAWIVQFPQLLIGLTYLTLVLESFGMMFLLIPRSPSFFRGLILIIFVLFHLSIDFIMHVGWLSWAMIIYWAAMIPSSWWEQKSPEHTAPLRINRYAHAGYLLIPLLILIIFMNHFQLQNSAFKQRWRKTPLYKIVHFLAIDQDLGRFSKVSTTKDRFYFLPIFEKPTPPYEHLVNLYETKPSYHWRKFFARIADQPFKKYYYPFIHAYLVNDWNKKHPAEYKIKAVQIFIKSEQILPYSNEHIPIGIKRF